MIYKIDDRLISTELSQDNPEGMLMLIHKYWTIINLIGFRNFNEPQLLLGWQRRALRELWKSRHEPVSLGAVRSTVVGLRERLLGQGILEEEFQLSAIDPMPFDTALFKAVHLNAAFIPVPNTSWITSTDAIDDIHRWRFENMLLFRSYVRSPSADFVKSLGYFYMVMKGGKDNQSLIIGPETSDYFIKALFRTPDLLYGFLDCMVHWHIGSDAYRISAYVKDIFIIPEVFLVFMTAVRKKIKKAYWSLLDILIENIKALDFKWPDILSPNTRMEERLLQLWASLSNSQRQLAG